MPQDLFEHIVAQVPAMTDSPILLHVDGEPTLHPKFLDYAKILNSRHIPFGLATNGSYLSEEHVDIKMEVILSISSNNEEFTRRTKKIRYESYIDRITSYLQHWIYSSSQQNACTDSYRTKKRIIHERR